MKIQSGRIKDTPDRIARMCMEIYGGLDEEADHHLAKQFEVENNEMVLEKDITFYSMCEHHLMPIYGKAHVLHTQRQSYRAQQTSRTVDVYARRPQIQERLTVQIADALERALNPRGVMVMLEAEHTCMTMRGIKKPGSKTITTVTQSSDDRELQETVSLYGKRLMSADMTRVSGHLAASALSKTSECPYPSGI